MKRVTTQADDMNPLRPVDVQGANLRGVDQAAQQAANFFEDERRSRNSGGPMCCGPTEIDDWPMREAMYRSMDEARAKGRKGGSTFTRDRIMG